MGVIHQGILGGISGKVGPVVGGSWKGISYLRGYQATVAQPNTAGQVAQKTRMRVIVEIAQECLTTVIKPLNDRFAVHMSGYNLFVSRNIEFISALGAPTWSSFIFSQGSLTAFDTLQASSAAASADVDFTWIDNSGTGTATSTDEFYAFVVNTTQGTSGTISGVDDRSAGISTVVMPTNQVAADQLQCFAAFRTANGFSVCNSQYLSVTSV